MHADMTAVTIQSEKVVMKERQLSTTRAILWKKKQQQQTFWATQWIPTKTTRVTRTNFFYYFRETKCTICIKKEVGLTGGNKDPTAVFRQIKPSYHEKG